MKTTQISIKIGLGIAIGVVIAAIFLPTFAHDEEVGKRSARSQYVVENAILAGLPSGALFPFIDVTPNQIVSAHIAITDASFCNAGQFPPASLEVWVGEAGGTLTNVMTAATNTGIGSDEQCVFHVTVKPGENGVPDHITDIVVYNGTNTLTALNTVTVSAEVR